MIQSIVDSILSTYDLSLNNEERRKKFEFINNYQENCFSLDDLNVLLSPNSNQQIKIFGFKCLENFVLYKWNTADKNVAKSYLFEVIKGYGNFMLDESTEKVVRWIIAKTVVYFIRHECPQNCDTIIDDLIKLQINGVMTKALILSIFFCLSETLPNDCKMPETRKKEVISFVTERSNIIISFCIVVSQEHCVNFKHEAVNLPLEAIKTIQSLSNWIKYETLLSMVNDILTVVINSLIVDSSDYFLFDVLETILIRKVRIEERYNLLSKIFTSTTLCPTFIANIRTGLSLPILPYSGDKFRYLQKMFDLLLIIGNLIVANWNDFVKDTNPIIVNDMIDLILTATHHPIKILSVEFLSFWSNGFKNEQTSLRNALVSKAQSLLPLLKSLSIKQSVRDPSNVDHEYLINLIEESESEAYIRRIRLEVSKTVNVLTQFFTQDIVTLALSWVHSIINTVQQMQERSVNSLQTMSIDSSISKELEASTYFIRCVLHSIFKPYCKTLREVVQSMLSTCSPDIISRSKDIIVTIIAYKDVNISISNIYLDILCLLLPFLAGEEVIIRKCLEKIFTWFNLVESVNILSADYGLLRQLQLDCGVWLLRVFRDYNFLIPAPLFEQILSYHMTICSPIHSRPNIMEALTLYICHSGNYSSEQKQCLLSPFIQSIRSVLCSEQVLHVFENGATVINHLQMERPKPGHNDGPNYPSIEHFNLRTNVSQAVTALLGLCRRLQTDQNETEAGTVNTKSTETPSIIACPMTEAIMPMLPSLLIIIRSLNQVWNAKNIHSDFSSLMEISVHYRDSLIKPQSSIEKLNPASGQLFGDTYVHICQSLFSKLHETVWGILAKCCHNFGKELYSLRDWSHGVQEYVFADLDSLPNFKLMSLIKIFLIPFVQCCPSDLAIDVLVPSIVPFINYLFQKLGERWALVEHSTDLENECDMDNESAEDHTDLTNEIIEEQILRITSKTFVNLFKLTMTIGHSTTDECKNSVQRLGVIGDVLCNAPSNGDYPMILILLNHLCHSITWKDTYCSSKLSLLIQPFVRQIHCHGLLTIDAAIFIMQQSIKALNIFAGNSHADIRLTILNLAVYLYDEHLSKEPMFVERFLKLFDKSPSKAIHTFQHKMMPNNSAKVKREAFQSILQPYIGVPTNEMFCQEVCIRNLPPLLKPEWKSKNQRRLSFENNEVLSLANLFDE